MFAFFEYLYGINEWLIFAVFCILLLAAMEFAFLFGRSVADRRSDGLRDRVSALSGTLLGTFALLVGFTFSMALSRFDSRKSAFQKEVNDIGTAYSMMDLLPQADAAKSKELFGFYVQQRVHRYWWERTADAEAEIVREADRLQDQIWDIAIRDVKAGRVVVPYLSALSETFDDRTARALEIENHVPEAIIWLMTFFALAAVATTGYASGLQKARAPFVRAVLVLSIALVLLAIIDLDRPRRGLIRIDQQALAAERDDILARNRAAGLPVPAIPQDEVLPSRR